MPHLLAANDKIAVDLTFIGPISIGRHVANSLPLPDPEVSRYHAQIFPRGDLFFLSDLGSRNGVYVNGSQVQEQELHAGDEICIGNTLLSFDPPEDKMETRRFSEHGVRIWKTLPDNLVYAPLSVTTFPPLELEQSVSNWLERQEKNSALPSKLRSDFLKFVLGIDRYQTRCDLCEAALRFLENQIGAQRAAVFMLDGERKSLEVLGRYTAEEVQETDQQFTAPKEALRIVLDAGKAVYCANTESDFRFKYLQMAPQNTSYQVRSFILTPIVVQSMPPTFLYLDQSDAEEAYDFKHLLQAYVMGTLLGKMLYWYYLGGEKRKV